MQQNDIPIQIPSKGGRVSINWADALTRAVNARRLIAGVGIRLTKKPDGIVIESTARGGKARREALQEKPFTCRYVTVEQTGTYTGWEIYLPPGCVNIESTYTTLNPKAKRKRGEGSNAKEVDIDDYWFRLGLADEDTEYLAVPKSSEDDVKKDRFYVRIHCKGFGALSGTDGFEDMPKRYFWAEAESVNKDNGPDKKDMVADIGDTFSCIVNEITIAEDKDEKKKEGGDQEQKYIRSVRNFPYYTAINISNNQPSGNMNLIYSFKVEANANKVGISTDGIYLTNKVFNAAGVSFVGNRIDELLTNVEGEKSVYLKIDTLKAPPVGTILVNGAVTTSGNGAGGGNGEQAGGVNAPINEDEFIRTNKTFTDVMVLLYKLKDGRITADNRNALNNLQVYQ